MEFRILGPLEVLADDRSIALGGPKPRALLARLLLQRNRAVSVDTLIDDLWGESPPAGARNLVQGYVSRLRGALGDGRLVTHPPGYRLETAPGEVDADRFASLAEQAAAARRVDETARAGALLRSALALWRGDALADVRYEPWAEREAERLEAARHDALEQRLAIDLELARDPAGVARELEALAGADPLDERWWELLVTALDRAGRRADALRAYGRAVHALRTELGTEPGPALRRIGEALARTADADPPDPPRAPGPAPRHHNLPAVPTSFVARERDLHEVRRLVAERVPVTLVGTGGVGKTRLAVEIARRAVADYPGGAWLVELAGVSDESVLAAQVAGALGIRPHAGQSVDDALVAGLASRQVLVVLDNCEHLVGPTARLAQRLVEHAPGLHLLATSRQPLGLTGEVAWPVDPLGLPDVAAGTDEVDASPAVRLFIDRARSALPGFRIGPGESAIVGRICRRLDGIPLAIELAAARVTLLTPAELDDRLADRFALLATESPVRPDRHRTLRATVGWSYGLLSPQEQRFFRMMSVFAGGFDLAAAQAVWQPEAAGEPEGAGEPEAADEPGALDLLAALVARSMMVRDASENGSRFRLLETLREFGAEALARDASDERLARERHAAWYLEFAARAEREIHGPDQVRWFDAIRAEQDNLRAAFTWLRDTGRPDDQVRLATRAWRYWEYFGNPHDGYLRLRAIVDAEPPPAQDLLAPALIAAGSLAQTLGDHDQAIALARRGLATYRALGDEQGVALGWHLLGRTATSHGNYRRAEVLLRRAIATQRRGGEPWRLALTLHHLGLLNRLRGRYDEARAVHEESHALFTRLGDEARVGYSHLMLGMISLYQGDYRDAVSRCEAALPRLERVRDRYGVAHVRALCADATRLDGDLDGAQAIYDGCLTDFAELGDRNCAGSVLGSLALLARTRGTPERAAELLRASLAIRRELRDRAGFAEILDGAAGLAIELGRYVPAARLAGAASRLREETGAVAPAWHRARVAAETPALHDALGESRFADAVLAGRALTIDAALELAAAELAAAERPAAERPAAEPAAAKPTAGVAPAG